MKDVEKKIRGYALKNAIAYNGKAQPGSVISAMFNEGLKKEDMKVYGKKINDIVKEINRLSVEEQKSEFELLQKFVSEREEREGLPELPNVPKSGVVMRFRPAPSGFMHIGHLISNMVNSLYVKKYGGKFYVIIDDTNPEKDLKEAYGNLKKDCDWVFGNVYKYLNASDRINLYYKYAEKLMKLNRAYVCTCSQEEFKEHADKQEECPCRKNSMKDNEEKWKKMLNKKGYKAGEAVLRFKTDNGMKDSNPAMRDFPLARINETPHPLQKKKYRVWPLMNLSVTVDDIELKMTHVIRGKDHADNAKRQEMIFKVLGKKFPWTFSIGRVKFTDLILSKRKITAAIKAGEFSGAEDEKLPTIASLRKRGYKPEAFAKLAEHRGLSEVDKVMKGEDLFRLLDEFNNESKK